MPRDEDPDMERPPFLGTWNRVYAAVLLYLTASILLFYWFSAAYR